MTYKRSNKRIQHRTSGGRFRKTTLADFGIQTVNRPRICSGCGHEWHPIVAEGICPKCDSQESTPTPPTEEETAKLAEYKAYGPFITPGTVHERQRLWEWLNSRGLFD